MTCTEVIKEHLDAHSSQWIPAPILYSLAEKNNYSHADIKQSLSDIAHTPPYGCISVQESDVHRMKESGITTKGVFYKRHDTPSTELKKIKDGIEYFDSMP